MMEFSCKNRLQLEVAWLFFPKKTSSYFFYMVLYTYLEFKGMTDLHWPVKIDLLKSVQNGVTDFNYFLL